MAYNKNSSTKTINKKNHAQYYTGSLLGDALVKLIPKKMIIKNVIDFSAGEGALLLGCKKIFPNCELHGIDIDIKNIITLQSNGIQARLIDATTAAINNSIAHDNFYCLSVGNPPFKKIDVNEHINTIFSFYGISIGDKIRAENYFLLYSLHIIKNRGLVAFIVPEGIISGEKNKNFRDVLAKNFEILQVMEIPRGIFSGTEAKTFIILIKKSNSTSHIKLSHFNKNESDIIISRKEFIERSDYKFYHHSKHINKSPLFNIETLRGDIPGKLAKKHPGKIIHTTSFEKEINYFKNNENHSDTPSRVLGIPGDILIPRVGIRSLGKVGVIKEGHFKLSDCIILLRPSNVRDGKKIIRFLNSERGKEFIKSISKGVGASYITLKDINLLPQYI